ncbi:hypothetical protein EX30DRAFT_20952 [Ascodesmis nigricans]|uniref:Uncharacterized protein n=1 Tax=Ascodesmis nigricans TaxID=341454 RepID=A0A4S2N7S5_9PEZI|nr:hypothetical protein EX30DRAFT_20952 [Ascodesmis nigricans]
MELRQRVLIMMALGASPSGVVVEIMLVVETGGAGVTEELLISTPLPEEMIRIFHHSQLDKLGIHDVVLFKFPSLTRYKSIIHLLTGITLGSSTSTRTQHIPSHHAHRNSSTSPPSNPPTQHQRSLQSTLLSSYTSTITSLSPTAASTSLPHYHRIAPTLSQIPAYQTKLSRLRDQMVAQQKEAEGLRIRTLEVQRRRTENRERIVRKRRKEGERDRTVLRARMAVGGDGQEQRGPIPARQDVSPGPGPVPVVVKRKKKARKVEM